MEGVVKRFGALTVLNGVDLTVNTGQTVAILGENGSGKTTLLRIAATLTSPTSGDIAVKGLDAVRQSADARLHIGAVMHSPMLYLDLTVRENLKLFATLCRLDAIEQRVDDAARRLGLTARLDERVRRLSHGYRKRVAIARAIIHVPPLLLLDEPATGLDEASLETLVEIIEEWKSEGRAVLTTTHRIDFATRTASAAYRMRDGRLQPAVIV